MEFPQNVRKKSRKSKVSEETKKMEKRSEMTQEESMLLFDELRNNDDSVDDSDSDNDEENEGFNIILEDNVYDEETEKRKEYLTEIKSFIDDEDETESQIFTEDELVQLLEKFEYLWNTKNLSLDDIISRTKENLQIPVSKKLTVTEIDDLDKNLATLCGGVLLLHRFSEMCYIDDTRCKNADIYNMRLRNLLQAQFNLFTILKSLVIVDQIADRPTEMIQSNYGLIRFQFGLNLDPKDHFLFILQFIQSKLSERAYRRHGADVYKPIYNDKGQYTYAWERECSIEEYITSLFDPDIEGHAFQHAFKQGIRYVKDAIVFFQKYTSRYFPNLNPCRYYLSFKNGVYFLLDDTFYPFDGSIPTSSRVEINEAQVLRKDIVSCNYFDLEFTHHHKKDNWNDIPTPTIERILLHQRFDKHIRSWVYVLMGRSLYPLGAKDEFWQICVFLLGFAGTGKSSLLQTIKNIYRLEDIGIVTNTFERQFGMQYLMDKKVALAIDINDRFQMDQADFQVAVSGEELHANRKHDNNGIVKKFEAPFYLSGNRFVCFTDHSGSLKRRVIPLMFRYFIPSGMSDPHLLSKLYNEIPNYLQKYNRAYLEYSELYGDRDIWDCLPEPIKHDSEKIINTSHPLLDFLKNSDICAFFPDCYVAMDEFKLAFYKYVERYQNSREKIKWNEGFYEAIFVQQGFEVKQCERKIPGTDTRSNKLWIFGVSVSEDFVGKVITGKENVVEDFLSNPDLYSRNAESQITVSTFKEALRQNFKTNVDMKTLEKSLQALKIDIKKQNDKLTDDDFVIGIELKEKVEPEIVKNIIEKEKRKKRQLPPVQFEQKKQKV